VPAGRKSVARREKKGKKLPLAPPPETTTPPAPALPPDPWPESHEEEPQERPAERKIMVRPYTRTGGRTHATGYRLELETLLSTPLGRDRDIQTLRADHRTICEMCRMPHSTAEIAARLGLPLGAARVLIADVVSVALLFVHETAAEDGPSMDLLNRVASGLRKL
jgi:DNA-directed RNA polymerase specialized sigma24 family protein